MWEELYVRKACWPLTPHDKIFYAEALELMVDILDEHRLAVEADSQAEINSTLPSYTQTMRHAAILDYKIADDVEDWSDTDVSPDFASLHNHVSVEILEAATLIGLAAFDQSGLSSFTRDKSGGEMLPIPIGHWGVDRGVIFSRAEECAFNITLPFRSWEPATHWIFFDRVEFYTFCSEQREYREIKPGEYGRRVNIQNAARETESGHALPPQTVSGRRPDPKWVDVAIALAIWVHKRNDEAEDIAAVGPDIMLKEVFEIAAAYTPNGLSRSTYQPLTVKAIERFRELAEQGK